MNSQRHRNAAFVLTLAFSACAVTVVAGSPNVAHLPTYQREQVLACEKMNGFVEAELRRRGAEVSLSGMCMFGQLQRTNWYQCMSSVMSKGGTQAAAAKQCQQFRTEVSSLSEVKAAR